ncbi:hypothetical protein ED733_000664 [Metarhizium rileyi]|uniref:Uncharacterized protein n=1 Tax=Metarhizium rileyi (strain RCEF 4871) TaxID=1649241 RepID=A0A5C6G2G0_METRR|nr:hypothetical protein ED733_000664 [Metarhizium rileyi]
MEEKKKKSDTFNGESAKDGFTAAGSPQGRGEPSKERRREQDRHPRDGPLNLSYDGATAASEEERGHPSEARISGQDRYPHERTPTSLYDPATAISQDEHGKPGEDGNTGKGKGKGKQSLENNKTDKYQYSTEKERSDSASRPLASTSWADGDKNGKTQITTGKLGRVAAMCNRFFQQKEFRTKEGADGEEVEGSRICEFSPAPARYTILEISDNRICNDCLRDCCAEMAGSPQDPDDAPPASYESHSSKPLRPKL